MKNTPQTLKGFRDFLPRTMVVRNYVKDLFTQVFTAYGFLPLETPSLEYASTLMGKYGSEADRLVYLFKDRGGREVGLRYDLTVPQSKVLSIYQDKIALPFKAYQIQPVWRADNTQKGRYREFVQCEANIFGSASSTADAEIIYLISAILDRLNLKKYQILINSRAVLSAILSTAEIPQSLKNTVIGSLDKLDKIGQDGVVNELASKGLSSTQINQLFEYIKTAQPDENLKSISNQLSAMGLSSDRFTFTPTLARGLDYYTGPIFEAIVEEPKIGALCGGGRFDQLIKSMGGPDIPATGFAFGFERIIDSILELNLLPNLPLSPIKVLVANFSPDTLNESLKLLCLLRQANVPSSFYPDPDKLGKQIKYALALGIPYLAIIGPDEAKNNAVVIKNLTKNEQKTISQAQALKIAF